MLMVSGDAISSGRGASLGWGLFRGKSVFLLSVNWMNLLTEILLCVTYFFFSIKTYNYQITPWALNLMYSM